jgi:hypothetical protein
MEVQVFLAADYANVEQSGKLNVMGIFRDIYANNFPARHSSMFLVLKLGAQLGEYGVSRNITIKLLNADGIELLNITRPIDIPKGEKGRRPEINMILGLRDLVFPEPGDYQFVVLVDNDWKGELPISIIQMEQK